MDRFVGKYLGLVVDNNDPKHIGRIRVKVPEVLPGETTGWAMPSSPLAGKGTGLAMVPPANSLVFVEWPAGDVARVPIWSGGAWAEGDGVAGAGPDAIVLVTPGGHRVELKDTKGQAAVTVKAASGATVILDDKGVTIEFSGQKVAMTSASISLNDGALTVM